MPTALPKKGRVIVKKGAPKTARHCNNFWIYDGLCGQTPKHAVIATNFSHKNIKA